MFPSKSDGMFMPESLIFRSNSNSEDFQGYAGASLYDSITMAKTELKQVDHNGDRYDSCTLHTLFATAPFVVTVKNSFVTVSGLSSHSGPCPTRKSERMLQSALQIVLDILHLHVLCFNADIMDKPSY